MCDSLSLIKSRVLWIRSVGSPTGCPNTIGQIFLTLLVAGHAQVLLRAPHSVNDEHDCLPLMTPFAKLFHW